MVNGKLAVIDEARFHVGRDEGIVGPRRERGVATNGKFIVHIFDTGDAANRVADFLLHLLAGNFAGDKHAKVETGDVNVRIPEAVKQPCARFPFDILVFDIDAG